MDRRRRRRRPDGAAAPPFAGGLVGYLGYDLGRRLERLPSIARVDQHLPVLRLALHDWVLAWDRRTGAAWLAAGRWTGTRTSPGRRVGAVLARLDALVRGEVASAAGGQARPRPGVVRVRAPRTRRGSPAWRPCARPSAAARSTRRTSPAASRRPFAGDPGPSSAGSGPATRRCSPAYLDLGAVARDGRAARPPVRVAGAVPLRGRGRPRRHRPDQGHPPARPDPRGGPGARPRAARQRARTGPRT